MVNTSEPAGEHLGASDIVKEGIKAGWPICLGYFPIGLAFGVLAQKAGLHPLEIGLMSVLVFAGSSQFIAVSSFRQEPLVLIMRSSPCFSVCWYFSLEGYYMLLLLL